MPALRSVRNVTALFTRTVRVEENSARTPWLRGGVCLMVLVLVGMAYQSLDQTDAPGAAMLSLVMWLNLLAVLVSSVTIFPSSIVEEKEQRTLGLMLMADISPLAILLGKAGPKLASALVLIAVQLPFVLLSITMGGVGLATVLECYWRLTLFAVSLSALATLASVVAPTHRKAASIVVAVLVVALLLEIAQLIAGSVFRSSAGAFLVLDLVGDVLYRMTPIELFISIPYGSFAAIPGAAPSVAWFDVGVAANLVFSGVCFGLAWLLFGRFALREPSGETVPRLIRPRASTAARPPRRAWSAAIVWKEFQLIARGWPSVWLRFAIYLLVAIGGPLAIAGLVHGPLGLASVWDDLPYITWAIGLMLLALELLVAASRVFRYELDESTWPTLALLPRSPRSLIGGKAVGALTNTLPSLMLIAVSIALMPGVASRFVGELLTEIELLYALAATASVAVLAIVLVAYFSLRSKYGAIPIAAAVLIFGNIVLVFLLSAGPISEAEHFFVVLLVHTIPAVFVSELIVSRLTNEAAAGN